MAKNSKTNGKTQLPLPIPRPGEIEIKTILYEDLPDHTARGWRPIAILWQNQHTLWKQHLQTKGQK
jgi:hypothetical protein